MDVRVLADALMTFLRCTFYPHEQTNVEVDSKGDEGFHTLTMLVCHRVYRVQNHAKRLLMAIGSPQWCCPVFIKANVWLACAKNRHIRKGDTKQSVVRQAIY